MSESSYSRSPLRYQDGIIYRGCLLQVVMSFTRIITRLNAALFHKIPPVTRLQRRIAEFLAVALVNLPTFEPGIGEARNCVNEVCLQPPTFYTRLIKVGQVFCSNLLRAEDLKHRNQIELTHSLTRVLARYEQRNALVIVSRNPQQVAPLTDIQRRAGVTIRSMDEIFALMRPSISSEPSMGALTSDVLPPGRETQAIRQIQTWWRSRIPQVRQRRTYMESQDAKAIQFFIDLGTRHHAPIALRAILVSQGVAVYLQISAFREQIAQLRQRIMSCLLLTNTDIPTTDVPLTETLDNAVHLIASLERDLKEASGVHMSPEILGREIENGTVDELMNFVEVLILDVELRVEEAEILIETIEECQSSSSLLG